ncbi:L,D-transpeptidase family protein [Paracoccus fontiphilus]|uniref:Murein L,D-transpeptidase family protein n=1 Tax=Paracoccus fontiphilus TaxID=1815556 RepID=A0ABV7IM92_9RHOB|nr:L,D-transpeptidase family protein [Paracoccus fontiphilus]
MKRAFCAFILLAASLGSPAAANVDPSGPEARLQITQLLLDKSSRRLYLLNGKKAVRSYQVDLGSNPAGPKQFQSDGRTPEGLYHITHRNPHSNFFLSLGISYPNDRDRARARALGRDPGGDIFIHGRGARVQNPPRDWTRGCAAVTDREMAEIFDLVPPGTPIFIKP